MKISHDLNGNKIVKISGSDLGDKRLRGFSVQTLGNLPYTNKNGLSCVKTTQSEIFNFIEQHGTKRQKALLQTEEDFNLQEIRSYRKNRLNFWRPLKAQDVEKLVQVIGSGCQQQTKTAIKFGLEYLHALDSSWVFERLSCDRGRWNYTAGQDYTYEMKTVRKVFA